MVQERLVLNNKAKISKLLKGLHNVLYTYACMIDARSLVAFLYSRVWRKTPNRLFWIYLPTGF